MATTKAFELAQLSALTEVDASGNVTANTSKIANASGDLTFDSVAGDIVLDAHGNQVIFKGSGGQVGFIDLATGRMDIKSSTADQQMRFQGNDGGVPINALVLDMAASGAATFLDQVTIGGNLVHAGNLTIDAGGDITLDADGADIILADATVAFGRFKRETSNLVIKAETVDKDIVFRGTKTGSPNVTIDALVLDMSNDGRATFNENVVIQGDLTVEGTSVTLNTTDLNVEDKNITLNYHATADTSASADGAGITIQDAVGASTDASILWDATNDKFTMSHGLTLLSANHLQFTRGGEIRSDDTGGTTRTLVRVNGTNELEYGWSGAGPVKFMGGGSYAEKIRIHTDGNVGIGGVTTPVTALHVDPGYVTLGGSAGTDNSWINNVEDGNLELVNEGRSTDSGAVRINRKNNPAGDTTYFRDTVIYDGKSNVVLFVDGSEGKVGIGTDTPNALLDLEGVTASSSPILRFTGTGNASQGDVVGQIEFYNSDTTDNTAGIMGKIRAVAGPSGGEGSLQFLVDMPSEGADANKIALHLNANGWVGIGTDTPNATLTLSDGTDEFDFGVTANQLMIKSVTSDGSDDQRIIIDAGNGGQSSTRGAYVALSGNESASEAGKAIYQMGNVTGSSHVFRKAGGIDAVIIDEDGQVGIGASPGRLLDIHKTDATQYDRSNISDGNSGATIRIINNDVANGPSYAGIHLQAYGASTNIARSFIGVVNDENWTSGGWSGTHHHLTFASRTSNFGNVRETMILTSDGNLGIGEDWGNLTTKRPMHKLDVDGAIATRQVRHSIRPSLNLDFANSKQLDSRITLQRDSIASYVDEDRIIKYANHNEARFDHDPVTGKSKGLLIEHEVSNAVPSNLLASTWLKTDWKIVPNYAVSPDGRFNAFSVFQGSASGTRYLSNSSPGVPNNSTFSIYAKKDGKRYFKFGCAAATTVADLELGTIATTSSGGGTSGGQTFDISDAGNGWYRLSITNYHATTFQVQMFMTANSGGASDADFGWSNNVLLWGGQLDDRLYATSYNPPLEHFSTRTSRARYHDKDGIIRTAPYQHERNGYEWDGHRWVETGPMYEESRINYLSYTSAGRIDSVSYSPNCTHGVSTAITAPDGSNVTTKLEFSAAGNFDSYQANAYLFNAYNTISVYIYPVSGAANMDFGLGDAPNNLGFGTIDFTNMTTNNANLGIKAIGETGWYRIWFTHYVINDTGGAIPHYFRSHGAGTHYIWGLQVEAGYYPSSYIEPEDLNAADVTRTADVFETTTRIRKQDLFMIEDDNLTSWYNNEEGTMYIEESVELKQNYPMSWTLTDTSSVNGGYISHFKIGTGSGFQTDTRHSGGDNADVASGTQLSADSYTKKAVRLKNDDFVAASAGVITGTDTDANIPKAVTKMFIGSRPDGYNYTGHMKKISYYPVALTNDELIALTEN